MSQKFNAALAKVDAMIAAMQQVRGEILNLQAKPNRKAPKPMAKALRIRMAVPAAMPTAQGAMEIGEIPTGVATAQPFKIEIRGGTLLVVTFPGGKEGYIANKHLLGEKVFGFSPLTKEWRANLAWVKANRPEILKGLGVSA
jgi:hypothetical protein